MHSAVQTGGMSRWSAARTGVVPPATVSLLGNSSALGSSAAARTRALGNTMTATTTTTAAAAGAAGAMSATGRLSAARAAALAPAELLSTSVSATRSASASASASAGATLLSFGDTVLLVASESHEFLAANVIEPVSRLEGTAYNVTAMRDAGPFVRNTWTIMRYAKDDRAAGDTVLHFNQPFHLMLNRKATPEPTFLRSERATPTSHARHSRHQEVVCLPTPDYNSLWMFVGADRNTRIEIEGEPVTLDGPVCLVHVATTQMLCAESCVVHTDFGPEHEISAHTALTQYKTQQKCNEWKVVTAAVLGGSAAATARDAPLSATLSATQVAVDHQAAQVLDRLRQSLIARGVYAIRGLGRAFRIMDNDGSRQLSAEEFKWGLRDYGVELTASEFAALLQWLDRDHSGTVSYDELLHGLRGELNAFRLALVQQAFDVMDADRSGVVTMDDVRMRYNAKKHPKVISGEITEEQALSSWLSVFDCASPDGTVTRDDFVAYYSDISASVDSDAEFELMIRRAWALDGPVKTGGVRLDA